jgi:hypothetical protein
VPDTGEDPHQPGGTVAAGGLAVCLHGSHVAHVGAGPLATRCLLINWWLVLEISCVMTEQDAILDGRHRLSMMLSY